MSLINLSDSVEGDGNRSIVVDINPGIVQGGYWQLEECSAFAVLGDGIAVDSAFSGLYLVPTAQAQLNLTADPSVKIVPQNPPGLLLPTFVQTDNGGAIAYWQTSLFGQIKIPPNYMIRAIIARYNAAVMNNNCSLSMNLVVREICDCP